MRGWPTNALSPFPCRSGLPARVWLTSLALATFTACGSEPPRSLPVTLDVRPRGVVVRSHSGAPMVGLKTVINDRFTCQSIPLLRAGGQAVLRLQECATPEGDRFVPALHKVLRIVIREDFADRPGRHAVFNY